MSVFTFYIIIMYYIQVLEGSNNRWQAVEIEETTIYRAERLVYASRFLTKERAQAVLAIIVNKNNDPYNWRIQKLKKKN